jgi:hypothetical protein
LGRAVRLASDVWDLHSGRQHFLGLILFRYCPTSSRGSRSGHLLFLTGWDCPGCRQVRFGRGGRAPKLRRYAVISPQFRALVCPHPQARQRSPRHVARQLCRRSCRHDRRAILSREDRGALGMALRHPGSNPDEQRYGRAASFEAARAAFEAACRDNLPSRSEGDFEAWRDERDWTENTLSWMPARNYSSRTMARASAAAVSGVAAAARCSTCPGQAKCWGTFPISPRSTRSAGIIRQ